MLLINILISKFYLIKVLFNYIRKYMEFSKFNYNGLVEYFKLSNTTELSLNLQFLEPMSIIINLAILSFQEENTKIAITNNNMFIQGRAFIKGLFAIYMEITAKTYVFY